MAVAMLALIVAVGGTAVAATKIGTNQIKSEAVTKNKIKKKAVSTNRIAAKAVTNGKIGPKAVKSGKIAGEAVTGSKIAAGAVDGSKVADDSLDDSKISDYKVLGNSFLVVTATNGPTQAAARAAAPENPMYKKGPLELYAKCFRDSVLDNLRGEIYVRTTADFSIMEGTDDRPGGPLATDYLNTTTLEVDRQLDTQTATGSVASYHEDENLAGAPDGTALQMVTGIGVQNGASAANGPYGPGNACIFQGAAMG
ncbi:MAG: hypothetical protein JJE10_06060 [Thermoleophilia bacterium]|nr:hypothetical protein [Thermoleophilia bacterium]